MFACIHSPDAHTLAGSFSPHVEMVDPQTAVFSLTPRQLPAARKIPRIAIASTPEAAILAARHFPGVTILPPGEESKILGDLPIDALPPDPEIFHILDLWGIRSLADLAALPENGLVERIGPRGVWLQKLARGIVDRPLKPVPHESTYEEVIEFDHPLELQEPVLLVLGRFLNDLCARLDSQSLAAGVLLLTLNRTERTLRLPFPTRDTKFLLKLLQHDLDAHKPDEPVGKIMLKILPTDPRRIQHGLFSPAAPEPEKLELTLGKIRGLVGEKNVKIPQLLDSYRPGWSFPEARLAFRYFRPPLDARVETESGVPRHLLTKLFQGKIVRIAGPWRSNGDWWDPRQWNRDEWDIALSDGALYRIYFDTSASRWFVEGNYD
jgi:protein ImuB